MTVSLSPAELDHRAVKAHEPPGERCVVCPRGCTVDQAALLSCEQLARVLTRTATAPYTERRNRGPGVRQPVRLVAAS